MSWHVYILQCSDKTFYTGVTTDLSKRLKEHNGQGTKGAKYTKARRPVRLVYSEEVANRSEAQQREHAIRTLDRVSKERLANSPIKDKD